MDPCAARKQINGDDAGAKLLREKAAQRSALIKKYFWNNSRPFFYGLPVQRTQTQLSLISPAGLYPFCFINDNPDYFSLLGKKVSAVVEEILLKPGGFVTTRYESGQQWDAPNGWAPLEWMMIWGLDRCGQKNLATLAAKRWIQLNIRVYKHTGKLMEKYDVVDINKEAGGGEYGGQDGFGMTNGVLQQS